MISAPLLFLAWQGAKNFFKGTALGAVLASTFQLTPAALTVTSLAMGFATAVTVALIGARGQRTAAAVGQGERDEPIERWVVESLRRLEAEKAQLEAENVRLREQIWRLSGGRTDPSASGGGSSLPPSSS